MAEFPRMIEVYQTSDGSLHESFDEASRAQAKVDFLEWYNDKNTVNELYDNGGGRTVGGEDVLAWLLDNSNDVMELLNNSILHRESSNPTSGE